MCVCLVAHSSLTLCDPVDYSPPGSSIHALPGDSLPSEPPGKPNVEPVFCVKGTKISGIGTQILAFFKAL